MKSVKIASLLLIPALFFVSGCSSDSSPTSAAANNVQNSGNDIELPLFLGPELLPSEPAQPVFVVHTDPNTLLQSIEVEIPQDSKANGEVSPKSLEVPTGIAHITVLAREITYGAGGPDVAVGLSFSQDGTNFSSIFSPAVDIVGHQYEITLHSGELVLNGQASFPTVNPFFNFVASSDSNNAIIFLNGATGPNIYNNYDVMFAARGAEAPQPPFGTPTDKQKAIWDIIQSSFDPVSHNLILPPGEALILFELGTNDSTSPAYDFQDLVIKLQPGPIPPSLWAKDSRLANVAASPTRLERYGASALVYKGGTGPKTYQVTSSGMITELTNWRVTGATDFVISDLTTAAHPAFFSKNSSQNGSIVLAQAQDFNLTVANVCDAIDFSGASLLSANVTTMEVLNNMAAPNRVLHWDSLNRLMRTSTLDFIADCFNGGTGQPIHSYENNIVSATGQSAADLTALAEDRMGSQGEFFAFDRISQSLLYASLNSSLYTVFLSKAQLLAANGMSSVNLGGGSLNSGAPGALITNPAGDLYAWDRVSQSLLFYKASNQSLTRLLTAGQIQAVTGGASVNIVDIDIIEAQPPAVPVETLILLDAASGAVLARPTH